MHWQAQREILFLLTFSEKSPNSFCLEKFFAKITQMFAKPANFHTHFPPLHIFSRKLLRETNILAKKSQIQIVLSKPAKIVFSQN